MLSPQILTPFTSPQLLTHLFSYFDLSNLYRAGLVSRLWQGSFKDPVIWRKLINQHFPYLPEKSVEAYQKDPKALFLAELKHIDAWISAETNLEDILALKKHLLTALRGEVEKIDQLSISSTAKEFLYTYAAANRHQAALDSLNTDRRIAALTIKAKNGYVPATRMITNSTNYCMMIEASAKGDVDTLQKLHRLS